MLSDEEKKELLGIAQSEARLRDFETMRRNSAPADPRNIDIDAYILFLTQFARLFSSHSKPARMDGKFLL